MAAALCDTVHNGLGLRRQQGTHGSWVMDCVEDLTTVTTGCSRECTCLVQRTLRMRVHT